MALWYKPKADKKSLLGFFAFIVICVGLSLHAIYAIKHGQLIDNPLNRSASRDPWTQLLIAIGGIVIGLYGALGELGWIKIRKPET